MKILVSGSTGFIGSNLVQDLLKQGHEVEGISRKPTDLNYRVHTIDLQANRLAEKIKTENFDAIVHLAGDTNEKDLYSMTNENVVTTLNMLEFAKEKKIKKFIFVSGHNVYAPSKILPIKEHFPTIPFTNYGCTKLLSENLVSYYSSNFDLYTTILRVSVTYGKGYPSKNTIGRFIEYYKNSWPISLHKYQNGFQKVDLINVSDVCNAMIKALLSSTKHAVYNIASGKPITVKDVIVVLQNNIKSNSKIIVTDIKKNTIHFYYDIKAAKKGLNFEPKISLEEGLAQLL
ncbi:MAG TPA: NAD(P)-dependent oxidoreductase [Candidatus Nitrosotalea sp.]|nr:NAD(P)-dependent oxidoreductase [Candidatus Nitrosotalea sp.]